MKKRRTQKIIAAVFSALLITAVFSGCLDDSNENSTRIPSTEITLSSTAQDEDGSKVESDTADNSSLAESDTTENSETETSEDNGVVDEANYEHNQYYDVVETASYKNSIGSTILVHKVLAKQNVSVSATLLASGADGNIIGKSTDDIKLTEGQYNFFNYYFDNDISNASIKATANAEKDSFMTGERNGVEMVQYNQSENDLYITFKQKVDKLGSFAKFKLLFYKGDKIVSTEEGYFNVYAENLNGKDSTDVAKIWAYGIDYDKLEYVFEP